MLEEPSSLMLRLLLKKWNKLLGTDPIKFQHTWSKQAGKCRFINFTTIFWIRKNCCTSVRSLLLSLLFLFVRRLIRLAGNYAGISLLSTFIQNFMRHFSCKVNYVEKFVGDHHCGFQCNGSTTDQIFCIHQILQKNDTAYQHIIHLVFNLKLIEVT